MKLFFIFSIIIILILLIIMAVRQVNNKKKTYEELKKKYKDELLRDCAEELQKLARAQKELTSTTEESVKAFQHLQEVTKEIDEKEHFNQTLYKIREEELNNLIENKKKAELEKVGNEIKEWASSAQDAATWERDQAIKQYEVDKEKSKEELQKILSDIEDYRKKRDAINQEILREKELKLKKDIHRIILSEEDKNDITFLISILPKINHKETVYKLIWSEYLMKPFQDMIKNSFGGKIPKNVIYCIESTDGKLKYIGKTSTDVSKRWTEHIKTSLNIGGVSRSKLHDALYLHWDEFLFFVIEETTKEQLSEKEKYYINFFESDKYGLNIKSGG